MVDNSIWINKKIGFSYKHFRDFEVSFKCLNFFGIYKKDSIIFF